MYSLVSLFCGAGGMDLGFKQAGFDILWANDFKKDAVITYKNNIGDHVVQGDIREISSSDIPDNPDVIIGGFPCQGFSIANVKRCVDDERNFLYLELLRVIKDKQPKVFVAENVKGILSLDEGKVIKKIMQDFESLGYNVDYKLLNSADYGVPQYRERVIFIGNRIGVKNIYPQFTHEARQPHQQTLPIFNKEILPYVTVKEAIGFLSDVELSKEPIEVDGRTIHNHVAYKNVSNTYMTRKYEVNNKEISDYLNFWKNKSGISNKEITQYFNNNGAVRHWFKKENSSVPTPKNWIKLKKLLKFDDWYDKQMTELVEKEKTYKACKLLTKWDKPSDTIITRYPSIHVNKKRRLSARECAILQTFPDDFVFHGGINSMHIQIGNAVPVLLAKRIAESVIKMLPS